MPATLDQGEQVWVVRLEGETDISCAAEFKNLLIQALASGKELRLDLQSTADLDITALQLLWAAQREARGSGKSFVLAGPLPEQVSGLCRDAGLDPFPVPAPHQ